MSDTQGNKARARKFYEAINKAVKSGDVDALDEFVADNAIDHHPAPGQGPGREGIKQTFKRYREAFGIQFSIEELLADEDKVVARVKVRGKHNGEIFGIPATGKDVEEEGIDVLRFDGDKVVERWGVFDDLSMMQQLGVVKAPT